MSDVSREDLALDEESEEEKKALADAQATLQPLTDYMKKVRQGWRACGVWGLGGSLACCMYGCPWCSSRSRPVCHLVWKVHGGGASG
jgi:hypothetical protein